MFVEASKAEGRKRLGEMVGDERTQESEEAKQGGRETQMIKIVPTRRRATSIPATASVVAKLLL